jgi:hypothetical protein
MNKDTQKIVNKYAKSSIGGTLSISDLSEREFSGQKLSKEEKQALINFDKFRLAELNKISDDMEFHERYRQLQVMANLADYHEFLKDEYSAQ